jgi:alpha-beta hydrolase superfamily lysophospholipase
MENLGFIADENPSNKMIADMHYLRTMIQKDNEDVPYFMLAHSMGSYLLRKYLTVYNTKLSGAIIVGTGYVPDLTTKLGMAACKCMAAFKGWHYRSKLVTDLSFGGAYNKFDKTGKNPERSWLSKNTESVKQYYSDPRCTFMFTLNGFYTLMETVYYDNQMKNIKKTPKSLPMFFISGDKDPVGDFGEGVKHVYHMYKAAGMENVDIKLYKDDRHEILNETDCDVVYDDIAEWIGRYIF